MIHGSFVDFEDEPDLLYNFEWIRSGAPHRPLLVLCYRWPSSIGCCGAWLGTFAVCAMAQRSEFHGFYVAQLINKISPANPVRLMGHSHGCRMISSALHLLSGGAVNGRRLPACSSVEPAVPGLIFFRRDGSRLAEPRPKIRPGDPSDMLAAEFQASL